MFKFLYRLLNINVLTRLVNNIC